MSSPNVAPDVNSLLTTTPVETSTRAREDPERRIAALHHLQEVSTPDSTVVMENTPQHNHDPFPTSHLLLLPRELRMIIFEYVVEPRDCPESGTWENCVHAIHRTPLKYPDILRVCRTIYHEVEYVRRDHDVHAHIDASNLHRRGFDHQVTHDLRRDIVGAINLHIHLCMTEKAGHPDRAMGVMFMVWLVTKLMLRLALWVDGPETRDAQGICAGALQIKKVKISYYATKRRSFTGLVAHTLPIYAMVVLQRFRVPKLELGSFVVHGEDTVEADKQDFLEGAVKALDQGSRRL